MKILRAILLILLLCPGLLTAGQAGGPAQVLFIPQWLPQAQFAGYYLAYEKGFYQKYGLDVKLLRGGPERPPSALLAQGRAHFGTMFLTTGIVHRAQGVKLVNIGQVVQRSALMLVAKKAAGIHTPADLQGKKVGLWGAEFQLQPRAFFKKYHLTVQIIPQAATVNLFLRGGVDAAAAMWYNEYHLLLNAGVDPEELTTFALADHGQNFPEDGIYCMEQTLRDHPDRCRGFVRASLEGWQYAFAHPEEAVTVVMKYVEAAHGASNRAHQQWMLARMREIIQPAGTDIPLGTLRPEAYTQVGEALLENGLIREIPPFADFYVNCGAGHEK